MKKKLTAALLIATATTLTACGNSEDKEATPERSHFDTLSGIEMTLSDSHMPCTRWDENSEESASCTIESRGYHTVRMDDDPELYAAVHLDNSPDSDGVVVGENWLFACGPGLDSSECGDVAAILSGELIERGHWSD